MVVNWVFIGFGGLIAFGDFWRVFWLLFVFGGVFGFFFFLKIHGQQLYFSYLREEQYKIL